METLHQVSKQKFSKMKVEEQMVPSAGFSPQPGFPDSGYNVNFNDSNMGLLATFNDPQYGILDFDSSLLDVGHIDQDTATVPSPVDIWDANYQQTSFYAPSPSSDFRAFSPECMKPVFQAEHQPLMTNPVCNNMTNGSASNGIPKSLSPTSDVAPVDNALLRRCLLDTTFQDKCNYKPVELPTITINDDFMTKNSSGVDRQTASAEPMDINPADPFFSLFRHDIQSTSNYLKISQDPTQWSAEDVEKWMKNTLGADSGTTTSASSVNAATLLNFWDVDGKTMSLFTEEEFRCRDPVNGDKLYATLAIWKMCVADEMSVVVPTLSELTPQQELMTLVGSVSTPAADTSSAVSASEPVCLSSAEDIKLFPENYLTPSPQFSSSQSSCDSSFKPSDDDDTDEEDEKPAGKGKTSRPNGSKSGSHIHLWQFLKELLESGPQNGSCIRWLDQNQGVFKIEDSVRVAHLWGIRKNRPAMNYDKLSRSIRQYYKKGIMRKTERSQRLVYQFCHPYGF